MHSQDEMFALARRALDHFLNHTTDQAPDVLTMPIEAYADPLRYRHELDRVFMRLPLALALSIELPTAGSYIALQPLEVPVLLTRGKDNKVRAFLNVCRHRGARLCALGSGSAKVFSCPYHAWVYDDRGALISRYGASTFGDVEHNERALVELACAERAGLIWVTLTPGLPMDIDAWLGSFAAPLASLRLDTWTLFEQREIPGPGWKVTMDGYLEVYHHNAVHGRTVGQHTIGNLLVLDTFGPHQRMTFGRQSIGELANLPEVQWEPEKHIRLVHSGFPNLSVSGILGDHCLVSFIFPGLTPTTTSTRQIVLAHEAPTTPEALTKTRAFSEMVRQAICDEDYPMGFTIQNGIASGANSSFLFGRNELAVQNYHRNVARFASL